VRNFSALFQLNQVIEQLPADKPRGSFLGKIWDTVNLILCQVTIVGGHAKELHSFFCADTKSLGVPSSLALILNLHMLVFTLYAS